MKKFFVVLAVMLSSFCANAFDFDGINLNEPYAKVAQEIAKRGYSYNHQRNCLQGDCRGVDIFLSINYVDVTTPGMLGQLIIDIPISGNGTEMFKNITTIFNVLYHQIDGQADAVTYQVDVDGTELMISQKDEFITLIYNTPYYSRPKTK